MIPAFFHGLILAIGLIIPLGVQNVFIFNQGMYHKKWRKALPVVITASLCDNFLVLAAVLGVSVLVLKLAFLKYLLGVVGTIFLFYMGYITWTNEVLPVNTDQHNGWTLKRQVLFTLAVSLLNPHAIIDTIGVIGTSSLAYTEPNVRMVFTGSTMFVSWLWFLFLMTAGHFMGRMENISRIQKLVNRISAGIMWVSALFLIKVVF